MKSINNSHSASTDSTIFVKVIQPVSQPEQVEEFKSEFRFDLSKIIKNAKVHFLETRQNLPFNLPSVEKYQNSKSKKFYLPSEKFDQTLRSIQYRNYRKMNLPEKPFSKRRFWHDKVKKKENNPLLVQIREEIFKELKMKFGENNKQFYFDSNRERRKRNLRKKKRIIPEFAENIKKIVDSEDSGIEEDFLISRRKADSPKTQNLKELSINLEKVNWD
ncbi:uncharacterized protein LOC122501796 [Leptopilina heterotoma]|uniref:uncharacterized protein LOC122501796 n=1 Tax=Leptopilina heterotoma TaxID=63436 RepID=UPI001CA80ABF|nr:uncharacterized protein LOC122501796 [Leptopilina heterotoma]